MHMRYLLDQLGVRGDIAYPRRRAAVPARGDHPGAADRAGRPAARPGEGRLGRPGPAGDPSRLELREQVLHRGDLGGLGDVHVGGELGDQEVDCPRRRRVRPSRCAPRWCWIIPRRNSRSNSAPAGVLPARDICCVGEHPPHRVVAVLAVVVLARVVARLRHLDALRPRATTTWSGSRAPGRRGSGPPAVRTAGSTACFRASSRHLQRLGVVRDHHLHEGDVGVTRLLGDSDSSACRR